MSRGEIEQGSLVFDPACRASVSDQRRPSGIDAAGDLPPGVVGRLLLPYPTHPFGTVFELNFSIVLKGMHRFHHARFCRGRTSKPIKIATSIGCTLGQLPDCSLVASMGRFELDDVCPTRAEICSRNKIDDAATSTWFSISVNGGGECPRRAPDRPSIRSMIGETRATERYRATPVSFVSGAGDHIENKAAELSSEKPNSL